jgi:hypothetical protein
MNVGSVSEYVPSTEYQVETPVVRPGTSVLTGSGNVSTEETPGPQKAQIVTSSTQDEVKVQLEPPGEIVVYQFVNQQGSLILQVPSEQILSLARQIAQELAQESAPKEPVRTEGA